MQYIRLIGKPFTIPAVILAAILAFSANSHAATQLDISHQIVSSSASENGFRIVLDVTIHNPTATKLNGVKLSIDGREFSEKTLLDEKSLGTISSQGIRQFYWTIYSNVEPDYFTSAIPIQMRGSARTGGHDSVDLNLFSTMKGGK